MKDRMEAGYKDMLLGLCRGDILERLAPKVVERIGAALSTRPQWLKGVALEAKQVLGFESGKSARLWIEKESA